VWGLIGRDILEAVTASLFDHVPQLFGVLGPRIFLNGDTVS
jgi:hypothetical protein